MTLTVDGLPVKLGMTLYDERHGAGKVTTVGLDSFVVTFGASTSREYFNLGTLAGVKRLRAANPIEIYPAPDQVATVLGILKVLGVKHSQA